MTGTIKIMQPVMQEVELSKADLLAKLLPVSKTGLSYGTLVFVNRVANKNYGLKCVDNALGAVVSVNPTSQYHPISGHYINGKNGQEQQHAYVVNYMGCSGCIETSTFVEAELKLAE